MRFVEVDTHVPFLEVVERKGVGHPDTVADGIAELASIRYSQYCLDNCGAVLHHSFDKVGVFGGRARFDWSGGEFDRPIRVVFGGRASKSFGGDRIPLQDILEAAATEQIGEVLRSGIDVPVEFVHLTTDSSMYPRWFAPESLDDVPDASEPRSNDTAFVTASFPVSTVESLCLASERLLWKLPWVGTDIKVLAVRAGDRIDVAVTAPALAGTLNGLAEYRESAEIAKQMLVEMWSETSRPTHLTLRAIDDVRGTSNATYQDCYVNLSGSALDYGEDGMVGRGNGRNGLIAPSHGSGNEVCFGKNPAYMVGKVAGWLADRAAAAMEGPARVQLVYRRGARYTEPSLASAMVGSASQVPAAEAALEEIGRLDWLDDLVVHERYRVRKA